MRVDRVQAFCRFIWTAALVASATASTVLGGEPREDEERAKPAVVQSLIESLDSPQPRDRARAAQTLGRLKVADEGAITALVKALNDVDSGVRSASVQALGDIGPQAKEAVPALIKLGKTGSVDRVTIVSTLGAMAADSEEALKALLVIARGSESGKTRVLGREVIRLRLAACEALGHAGPNAEAAVPVLIDILNYAAREADQYTSIYVAAARSLSRIGDERAVPVLTKHRAGTGVRGFQDSVQQIITAADTALREMEVEVKGAKKKVQPKRAGRGKQAVPAGPYGSPYRRSQ